MGKYCRKRLGIFEAFVIIKRRNFYSKDVKFKPRKHSSENIFFIALTQRFVEKRTFFFAFRRKKGCRDMITCPSSRIVVSRLLRESVARLTPCFVSFASKNNNQLFFIAHPRATLYDLSTQAEGLEYRRGQCPPSWRRHTASFVASARRIANNPKQVYI